MIHPACPSISLSGRVPNANTRQSHLSAASTWGRRFVCYRNRHVLHTLVIECSISNICWVPICSIGVAHAFQQPVRL